MLKVNEATTVDLKVIYDLKALGWKEGDTLLYQQEFQLTPEQQKEFHPYKSIKPDIVLLDLNHNILAVFENKLKDEKKALTKLRTLYAKILKPRFLYACSKEKTLFLDTTWSGEDAEFRNVNSFLTLEEMKMKISQENKNKNIKEVHIDKIIAGGYDSAAGKDRYFQTECIETLINKYRDGKQKMLVHMATGLGKTRTSVALCKALFDAEMAKRVLFVVDRVLLAKQALDEGFSLISGEYPSSRLRTSNFKQQKHTNIHVVVIDTLELIFNEIPSNYYDLIIVDECHRSITINRKLIFDHFLCPRIGLTATPRIAIKKNQKVSDEDMAIIDTYRLFGCEVGEPDYEFALDRGIDEGFLAPYKIKEITTYLTELAKEKGVEFDYVLDPEEREKIQLGKKKKLKLEQLERKYISEERSLRIAEELRGILEYGEKAIVFGVSQAHCILLANAINKIFNDPGNESPKYCEAIISENSDLNETLKGWFKKPYRNPHIVTSIDIMSTGVDIPCVRYIVFAALTKSVGKYIQMLGRGTRLDIKTGKVSFTVIDFVGLCKRMNDNGKGSPKQNEKVVKPKGENGGGGGSDPDGRYFLIDNPDPKEMITRYIWDGKQYQVQDNIPIEEARRIFEESLEKTDETAIVELKEKAKLEEFYPSDEDLEKLKEWIKAPDIFLDEGQLQRIYNYADGTVWEFILHAIGVRKIPTMKDRIIESFEKFIKTRNFNEKQIDKLKKYRDIIIANIEQNKKINLQSIFSNPVYEKLIGTKRENEQIFDGDIKSVFDELNEFFNID